MTDTILVQQGRVTPKQTGAVAISATGNASLRVAQFEAEGTDLTRMGRRFAVGINATPTGIAPVQAIATTAAQWTLWNTSTTDSMVFEKLGVLLASGTAGAGIVVHACIFTAPAQTGLATGLSAQNTSGSTRASAVAIKSGVTITAPALPFWFPVAYNINASTAVLSVLVQDSDLKGKIIVPPSQGLGLYVSSPAGTSPLFTPHAMWTEIALDLE